jgi:hypothetical protein
MKWNLIFSTIFLSLAVIGTSNCQAGDLIVSSLSSPSSDLDYATVNPPDPSSGDPGFAIAQEFTSSFATPLLQVVVNIGGYNAGVNGDTQIIGTLFADNGGVPTGALLTQFTYNPADLLTAGFKEVTFTPTTNVNLTAGTGYWFVLSAISTDGGGINWKIADDNSGIVGPGSLPGYTQSPDSGTTWDDPKLTPPDYPPFLFAAYGPAAVPEPSSWITGSVGILGVALVSRRSRSGRAAA